MYFLVFALFCCSGVPGVFSAKTKCELIESPVDTGCCFNEPIYHKENVTRKVYEYKHVEEEIWTCKNFTVRNETCVFGPRNCTTNERCIDKCKFVTWPGKCSNVTEKIPDTCKEWCEGTLEPDNTTAIPGFPRHRRNFESGCCTSLSLSLQGFVQNFHSNLAITFKRAQNEVNGFPSWTSESGEKAIWHVSKYWCIGNIKDLGSVTCQIHSTMDISCPSDIGSLGWKFWSWTDSEFRNVKLGDLNVSCGGGRYKRDVTDGLIGQRHFPQTPRICKEICEYETTEVCADFPEVKCEKDCICEPTVECTPIEHIGCSFVKEKINTKQKKPVEKTWEQIVWKDNWWCKKCEGEEFPSTNCHSPPRLSTDGTYY